MAIVFNYFCIYQKYLFLKLETWNLKLNSWVALYIVGKIQTNVIICPCMRNSQVSCSSRLLSKNPSKWQNSSPGDEIPIPTSLIFLLKGLTNGFRYNSKRKNILGLGSTPSRDLNLGQSLVLLQQQAKEFIKPRKGISAC